ncbi:PRP1 splicing factor, N-terminal-domain-containing protein [Kockovaella imperatae]|uniref:PRP1 splicing factor, N-terminal-domain-containing protein n=1 Tax=Kockovaella imperatae TaxID=4999 RepID=A0A1Y1UH64_9TREE|nr:PRP1 splicing factor, N-terminal-domain-containing protein [Kockovaella imperatae]ORX36867.1 PRP1 splicing factor, N-terminal-domain-containing protein [Kockovaella imperatae]
MAAIGTVKHVPKEIRYNFLNQAAPASYVAGLGRGASGFTTRSDIGPAREGPSAEAVAEAQARRGEDVPDPDALQDPDDERNLFAGTVYEADDEEADKIWESVDERMDARRRARREAAEAAAAAEERAKNPKLQTQFADLKRSLSTLKDSDWENIPEAGNLTGKRRKQNMRLEENQNTRSYAVSDSVLADVAGRSALLGELDAQQQENGGLETPAGDGTMTDFISIGNARDKVLSLRLDQASKDAANGSSTSIDPRGYMTALNSQILQTDAQIGDIKQARQLLQNLIQSNPKHAPGWIAAASLEVHAKKMVAARKIIAEGCEKCPKSEDVWFHAAELNTPENAKVVLGKAVQNVPQSVKIWLKAASLESEPAAKKRVLRKALEFVPNSVRLWKETVNLEEDPEDARILLTRAVEVIPNSVELWLTLARLETPENAKKVLNSARKVIPTSHEIWIAAGRLAEQTPTAMSEVKVEYDLEQQRKLAAQVDKVMAMAVSSLQKNSVILGREQWLQEAEQCEQDGSPLTAQAIVKATIHLEVEEEDRKNVWLEDAERAEKGGFYEVARACFVKLLEAYPTSPSVWRRAAEFEKAHGTPDAVQEVLAKGVQHCPHAEVLWLMAAKEKWMGGDIPGAHAILADAFKQNEDSESIFLAAAKLASETNEMEAAQQILQKARAQADTERIWMKSAMLERQLGMLDAALDTLQQAISKYPGFDKLHMIRGQILESRGETSEARSAYAQGCKSCPKSIPLWILSARLEEKAGIVIKARSLLEKARLHNPKNDELWMESIKIEERSGSAQQAKSVLARAMQECPTSPLLWSLAIFMEAPQQRKGRSVDALKKAGEHPAVIIAVARLFWAERKIEKTRQWMQNAITADADWGDAWGWWLKFERQHGEPERQQLVIDKCVEAQPHHGPVWQAVAKNLANVGKSIPDILELVADKLE